jgi:hypothetical protein
LTHSETLQRLCDIEEIKQMKGKYFRCIDAKDWRGWKSVFTPDVHFDGDGYVKQGRDELVSYVDETLGSGQTIHQGHTPEITFTSADTAEGIWALFYLVTMPDEAAPKGVRGYGHSYDSYVRTEEGWRIDRVRLHRLHVEPR